MPTGSQGPQQTNDLGEFRIAGLAAGEYIVAASRGQNPLLPRAAPSRRLGKVPGLRSRLRTHPGTTDQNGASPIAVGAGVEVGNVTFTVQSVPAHNVSGVVVDENGSPLAGAMVTLMGDPRTGVPIGPAGSARTCSRRKLFDRGCARRNLSPERIQCPLSGTAPDQVVGLFLPRQWSGRAGRSKSRSW